MLIYHIVLPEVWAAAKDKTFYEAASLAAEGFIHCSYADQLDGVVERYYSGMEKVVILTIDANKLTSPLVSEPSTNNEAYPHIYGPINTDAVTQAETRAVASVPANA
ncbi:MAG: DUF952 domain-containing protein [Acidobacteria bacterium]|nr:DUF952 domain-containing protein [Acidobacteriota bacterium]